MFGLYAAVTRATLDGKNPNGWFPEQKLTVQEAVESFLAAAVRDMDEYRGLYEKETGEVSRLWLIPTAEVPLTNLVRESIVDEAQLPIPISATRIFFSPSRAAPLLM